MDCRRILTDMETCSGYIINRKKQISNQYVQSLYTHQDGYYKLYIYDRKQQYWRECGKTKTLMHHQWEYTMMQPLQKRVWQFLKNLNRIITWSSKSTPRYSIQRTENRIQIDTIYQCSQQHYPQQTKGGNNASVHHQTNSMWYIIQP